MLTLQKPLTKGVSEKPPEKPIRKILLIDGEANGGLSNALARDRCNVIHCKCVQEAWNFVYPRRPDLIVFRLRKSDQTALSDLHECRALARSVPILVASSAHVNGDILKALPRGRAAVVADCVPAELAAEILRNPDTWTTEH